MVSQGFKRADRVGESIARQITWILQTKVNDPRLTAVVITGVKVTDDLRTARIYFNLRDSYSATHLPTPLTSQARVLSDEEKIQEAMRALKRAEGHFKREISRSLELRSMPEFEFHLDSSMNQADRIETLLDQIHVEQIKNKGGV